MMTKVQIVNADVFEGLAQLPSDSVNCVVTSPPYWGLRSYLPEDHTTPFSGAHFATMPVEIATRCIKAGCPTGGTVLDPFAGVGTTGLVADRLGCNAILIELNPEFCALAERRIANDLPMFADVNLMAIFPTRPSRGTKPTTR